MKQFLLVVLFVFSYQSSQSQTMSNQELGTIISVVSDNITGNTGRWQFNIKDTVLICLTDSTNNRMRIMSPVMESYKLTEELKTLSLSANFHTALDVKYAISDNVLWSVFTHPLKELSKDQVIDAISQVYYANVNFGSSFASTSLVFPGRQRQEIEKKKSIIIKEKF